MTKKLKIKSLSKKESANYIFVFLFAAVGIWLLAKGSPAPLPATTPICTGLVTHTNSVTMPQLSKPGYLQSYTDPTFGTKVTRITGNAGTAIPTIGGTWSDVARHHYSKDAVWNADQSLLYISRNQSGPNPLYLDGNTYQPLFSRSAPGEERWHPTDPNLQIYMGNNEIGTYNVRTGQKIMSHSVAGYSNFAFGPSEGNPSQDGKWVAPLANSPSGKQVAFAFNLESKQKFPDIDLTGVQVDWVSISALGQYIVVNGTISSNRDSTQVYDLQGNKIGSLWAQYGRPSHYDLTIDQNGDEVAVGVSKSAPDEGKVIKRRLNDGTVTALTTGGYASHTSARATQNPGWVLASYDGSPTASSWLPFRNELVAVKLDGSGVMRLNHLQTNTNDYYSETHGALSPDGMRAVFAGNWNASSGRPLSAYVVDFRDKCNVTPQPPPSGGDTTKPVVTWLTPAANATVSGVTYVNVDATDNVGVSKVEFKIDNGPVNNTELAAAFDWNWTTTDFANGTHTITATAYDAAGNTTSLTRSFNVNNAGQPPQPPPVYIPEDINMDGQVNILDFSLLSSKFGATTNLGRADINQDGRVNIIDFSLLAAKFGA